MKPIFRASLIAAAIFFLPLGAQAAGLGQITVQSNLGEPLSAEIQLNATQQELQSLTARVAPPDVFLQANIPYASFVPNVRVTVENRGDRSVLKLSSSTPVNEAVASLIIQLNWDEGRLARTYNFLLDPADLAISPPAPVEPIVIQPAPTPLPPPVETPPVRMPVETTAQTQAPQAVDLGDDPVIVYREREREPTPVYETETETVVPAPQPQPQPERVPYTPPPERYVSPTPVYPDAAGDDYTVRYGDTLGSIASRRMPTDVTLDQMVMALYRANPTAFVGNNVNRLKSGAVLRMPSADDVRSSDQAEARREVRMHARDFNLWRSQLASEVASRPATPVEEGAGGSRAIDTLPSTTEREQDKVVIATSDPRQGNAGRLRELEENIAATQNSLKEASARVEELEGINRRLESLVALKNQEVARLQARSTPVPTPEPTPTPEPAPVPEPTPEPVVETPPTPEPPLLPPDAVVEPEPEPVQDAIATEEPLPDPITYSKDYEDPLWEAITDPQILGVGALIIALLGGFLGFRSWQRKRSEVGLDTLSQDASSMFPSEATSIFGNNGGQSVDTTASVIHTDFSQTGLSIDTNEGVDPVAEADVYMAYGRDSQAEEILNDALKADPKRGAIYVKLLEIYAQRQDLAQFEATASELFSRMEGQGRDWEKAAQMGRRLDPSNPLYSGKSPKRENEEEFSRLPGLEPTLEEPSRLDLGVPTSHVDAGSGPTLADLDFGTSPATQPAADVGQLKDTMTAPGQLSDISISRAPEARSPARTPKVTPPASSAVVDFQFEPAGSATPKAPGSIDFDLGKPAETGKQPISVTVSRSKQSASRKAGSKTTTSPASDLAGPLDFDLRTQNPAHDMSSTTVLPRGGNERGDDLAMEFEKAGFDPNALDFDLDLDLKPTKKGKSKQSAIPAPDPVDTGEIDTRLELARAYGDMGDTEGALELLREVAAEGNAAQRAEAQALIAKLG